MPQIPCKICEEDTEIDELIRGHCWSCWEDKQEGDGEPLPVDQYSARLRRRFYGQAPEENEE